MYFLFFRERGSDASWRDDAEVPDEHRDFSDDEAEIQKNRSKRAGKHPSKPTPTPDSSHAQNAPKKRAPRYSGDPKMRAYFPRAEAPPPNVMGNPPPTMMGNPPPPGYPGYGGGMAYHTPQGFVGFLPPGMAPHAQLPPQGECVLTDHFIHCTVGISESRTL